MKRILIIAVSYPPSGQVGAKRPYKIANFLADIGWDVTILTVDPALSPPAGPAPAEKENIRIIRTKAFVPYVVMKNEVSNRKAKKNVGDGRNIIRAKADGERIVQRIKRLRNYLVKESLTALDQIDKWSGWRRQALRVMRKNDMRFDVVLSTSPPHSTAYLGMELAAFYKCKLVLDYRDPWADLLRMKQSIGTCSARKLSRHIKIENKCLNAADLILTVSPAISEQLSSRVEKKVLTIPQGFQGTIRESAYDTESTYLLYAGSLGYGRDLLTVLSAIKYINETSQERMRLVYCGGQPECAYEQAISVGAAEYIDIKGPVRENEVFDYARKSLCNIVVISAGYEYAYPGKVFDLIPAARPIYVISPSVSEAGKLVEEYGIGFSMPATDSVGLARKFKFEIERDFSVPNKVNDLKVERIYERMVRDGLNLL